jgi:hypothetical protein
MKTFAMLIIQYLKVFWKNTLVKIQKKTMDQTGPAFRKLTEKFPGISAARIKEVCVCKSRYCRLFRGTMNL